MTTQKCKIVACKHFSSEPFIPAAMRMYDSCNACSPAVGEKTPKTLRTQRAQHRKADRHSLGLGKVRF